MTCEIIGSLLKKARSSEKRLSTEKFSCENYRKFTNILREVQKKYGPQKSSLNKIMGGSFMYREKFRKIVWSANKLICGINRRFTYVSREVQKVVRQNKVHLRNNKKFTYLSREVQKHMVRCATKFSYKK